MADIPAGFESTDQLAGRTGYHVTRIRQLAKEPGFPKAKRIVAEDGVRRDYYPALDFLAAIVRYQRDEARRSTKSAGENKFRDVRAAEVELRMAERRRDLISFDDANAAVSNLCAVFRQEMDGAAVNLTRDLDWRRKIQAKIDEILIRCARRSRAVLTALRDGRDPADAVDEK